MEQLIVHEHFLVFAPKIVEGQPFVQTERRLNIGNLLLIAVALAVGCWLFSWWLLIIWATILASLLGGRVMLVEHRPTRVFYLLAFAYLIGAVLIWLVSQVVHLHRM